MREFKEFAGAKVRYIKRGLCRKDWFHYQACPTFEGFMRKTLCEIQSIHLDKILRANKLIDLFTWTDTEEGFSTWNRWYLALMLGREPDAEFHAALEIRIRHFEPTADIVLEDVL